MKVTPAITHSVKTEHSAFPYDIVLDELLVAEEDLLPAEDRGLGPGLEGPGAGVRSCQHLFLGGFGNTSHHLISGLRKRRQPVHTVQDSSQTTLHLTESWESNSYYSCEFLH